jgi:hypothetical protein
MFACSDDSVITAGDDLNRLLTFPNSDIRRIVRVKLNNGYKSDTRLEFDAWEAFSVDPRITYEIVGEDKDVLHLSSQLDQILANCFLWYSPINKFEVFFLAVVMPILVAAVLCLILGLQAWSEKSPAFLQATFLGLRVWFCFLLLGAVLLALGIMGGAYRSVAFPARRLCDRWRY